MLATSLLLICAIARANNPGGDTPPNSIAAQLQSSLDAAAAAGPGGEFRIPAGDYRFGNTSLFLDSAEGLRIVAEPGSTLWFNYTQGFLITQSANLTVEGVTIDYDPPCFAQGVVLQTEGVAGGVTLNASQIVAVFDSHFIMPDPEVSPPFVNPGGVVGAKIGFWDPETLQQSYHGNQFLHSAKRLGSIDEMGGVGVELLASARAYGSNLSSGVKYLLTFVHPVFGDPRPNRTLVATFPRGGYTYTLRNSSRVTTRNLTIHGGGNMGVVEDGGLGSHYHSGLRIMRRPGASPIPLLALNADGFHSNSAVHGPTLEDAEISFTGDDHYNCHSRMLVGLGRVNGSDDELYVIATDNGLAFGRIERWMTRTDPKWSQIQIYQLNTLEKLDNVQIESLSRTQDPAVLEQAKAAYSNMMGPPYNAHFVRPFLDTNVWKIKATAPLNTSVSYKYTLVGYEAADNTGAVVRRVHFHDGFSRNLLMKSSNSVIQDSVFERAGGMFVFSEQAWLEGSLGVHNVSIKNNQMDGCAAAGGGSIHLGVGTYDIRLADNKCIPSPCMANNTFLI